MFHAELKVCPKSIYVLAAETKEELHPLAVEEYHRVITNVAEKSDYRTAIGSIPHPETRDDVFYLYTMLEDGHRVEGLTYAARCIFQLNKNSLSKARSKLLKKFLETDLSSMPEEELFAVREELLRYIRKLGVTGLPKQHTEAA